MNQRVESVRQPHHLDPRGNLAAGQSVRIAAAVPALVMMAADVADQGKVLPGGEGRVLRQKAAALGSMGLHDGKFLLGQLTRLVEDFLRDGPLAYIMEPGKNSIELDFFRSQRWNDSGGGKVTQKWGACSMSSCSRRRTVKAGSMFNVYHLID